MNEQGSDNCEILSNEQTHREQPMNSHPKLTEEMMFRVPGLHSTEENKRQQVKRLTTHKPHHQAVT